MRVSICGPNLQDQSKGQFHVHAADCGDLRHYGWEGHPAIPRKYGGEEPWAVEVETKKEAVEALYGPDEFEYDPDDPQQYQGFRDDMHFAPCLDSLPEK